jgi:hypothetical protein
VSLSSPFSLTYVETAIVKCVLVLCCQLGVWVVGVLSVRVGFRYAGLVLFGCRALGSTAGNQRSGAVVGMQATCAPIYTASSLLGRSVADPQRFTLTALCFVVVSLVSLSFSFAA